MSSIISYQNQWIKHRRIISIITLLIALFLAPQAGNAEAKKNNSNKKRLPPAPETGSPEGDFSAGGTRDNFLQDGVCDVKNGQIAYLLGNSNRDFTLSAYPTFWFHLPQTSKKVSQIKFVLTELETGKKIYDRTVQKKARSLITGISLPPEKQYALSPQVNYTWQLEVKCAETETPEIALEGWLLRKRSSSQLQNDLAVIPKFEKYQIYLQHNLWYDGLTELAHLRLAQPNSNQIEKNWHQLLGELGWQELVQQQSAIDATGLNEEILVQNAEKK